jgi:hypothetical protein
MRCLLLCKIIRAKAASEKYHVIIQNPKYPSV